MDAPIMRAEKAQHIQAIKNEIKDTGLYEISDEEVDLLYYYFKAPASSKNFGSTKNALEEFTKLQKMPHLIKIYLLSQLAKPEDQLIKHEIAAANFDNKDFLYMADMIINDPIFAEKIASPIYDNLYLGHLSLNIDKPGCQELIRTIPRALEIHKIYEDRVGKTIDLIHAKILVNSQIFTYVGTESTDVSLMARNVTYKNNDMTVDKAVFLIELLENNTELSDQICFIPEKVGKCEAVFHEAFEKIDKYKPYTKMPLSIAFSLMGIETK